MKTNDDTRGWEVIWVFILPATTVTITKKLINLDTAKLGRLVFGTVHSLLPEYQPQPLSSFSFRGFF